MQHHKIVVALGGNALEERGTEPTAENQWKTVRRAAEHLAELSQAGHEIAIVHGNGPQVGRILLASEAAADITPPLPFDVCGAMSQGYIGYHIQRAMKEALLARGLGRIPVVSLVTQVLVDEADPAFQNPEKPIGTFCSREEAERLSREKGYVMHEDAGRGYRRVVPSPRPQVIVEFETLRRLWDSTIVVLCGGGGIPVVKSADGHLRGVAAVIDKDLAAGLTARSIGADLLMILAEVEYAAAYFRTPKQMNLTHLTTAEARRYLEEGHFAAGSMKPKVEAAIEFAESAPGRQSVITSLENAGRALRERTGTWIMNA
ncbi:MAG: carbamate kinase [Lachnospiraceae bacterium]|nr:carbamate kinase [Lachnospiraceae bacterium]